ncbi:MAG: MopE-related protein, partial [Myxococcota bacterium]
MPDPFGAQFCTEPCPDAVCPHDGFDCILYEASEAEPQLLCTPEDDILCATCKDDTECAALGSSCITLSDGQACATACGQDGLCPVGFRCTPQLGGEGREVCLPTSSMCAGCVDGDDDSYGVGRLCEGFDCDDDDNSVHQNAPEICDGQDNDCDGEADEALALNVCGGCEPLDAVPGDPCGPCGLDELICGNGMLGCDGETACPVPVVMASDGTRTDAVEVIWQEIEGADRYQVFRDGERIAELASDEPLRYEDRGAAEGGLPGVVEAVNATDGDYTDRVELTWQAAQAPLDGTPHAYTVVTLFGERPGSMSASDTGYRAAEPITGYAWSANGSPWRAASGALSAVDMGAPAPRIAPGVAMASDGTSYDAVELTLEGVTVEPGAAVTYQVRAETATGVGPASEPNEGYRGAGAPALVWERSARDMDGGYQALDALQTASARDTGAPIDGSGRYYRARVSSPGAQEATSSPDRGYRAAIVCGNSIEDPGEECDDGDREDNDGCNARCEMEFCG